MLLLYLHNEKEKNLYLHNPWLKNGEYFIQANHKNKASGVNSSFKNINIFEIFPGSFKINMCRN